LRDGKLTLHATRPLRFGRYRLKLTSSRGAGARTTEVWITVGQTLALG
jgi:hypothetical protein